MNVKQIDFSPLTLFGQCFVLFDLCSTWCSLVTVCIVSIVFVKVAPYSFLSTLALISKIMRWRKLSNTTLKLRAGSRSKMPTNMASKLLKFVYRKCCVDRLRFQNICWLNRRPQLSLLDVKEKYTRHAGVSTNESDFVWFVRSPRSSSGAKQDGILPHIFAVLGVVCGADTKAKI